VTSVSFTLLSEGSSDTALLPLLVGLMRRHGGPQVSVQPQWADLRRRRPPRISLAVDIVDAAHLYPADLLFVHRDADKRPPDERHKEIALAVDEARRAGFDLPYLAVVPVRMQEAWLLVDETAIRRAAGNPQGTLPLDLPPLDRIEDLPDPKTQLHGVLRQASELRGRRLKKFNDGRATQRVAEYLTSFDRLDRLSAFQRLDSEIARLFRDMIRRKTPS
jgi:hypothetical protein